MLSRQSGEEDLQRGRKAAAEHIAVEASRLARMANANDFPLLAYLIDMAVLEAWREASKSRRGRMNGEAISSAGPVET